MILLITFESNGVSLKHDDLLRDKKHLLFISKIIIWNMKILNTHHIRYLSYTNYFVLMLSFSVGCSTIPKYPVAGDFLGESVLTTVDSEIAHYYLENYLQGRKNSPMFDEKIDLLYKIHEDSEPTREALKKIGAAYSVDFASLFLADRLWSNEDNRSLQNTFNRFLKEKRRLPYQAPPHYSSYMVLFVPGWDYVETGHFTGADFAAPRHLVTALGIENHFVETPPKGSVEENADTLSKAIIEQGQSGKKVVIVGASSAGPAIHLSLGKQLNKEQLQSVVAWMNIGGILQGSPVIDFYQRWPQRWLFNIVAWFKGWDKNKLMSMSVKASRERFKRLSISKNILVINYLGIPLSGQISKYSQYRYPLMTSEGPNDGLTLLTDAIAPSSITIIALGSDHFFAEDPRIDDKTIALTKTVISYLEENAAMQQHTDDH